MVSARESTYQQITRLVNGSEKMLLNMTSRWQDCDAILFLADE